MSRIECEFEADVLCAVLQSRWPAKVDAELRAHVEGCPICKDVTVVAAALDGEAVATRAEAHPLPDAGRVWWHAQLRARREAVKDAGRPITAAQVLTFAAAMGLLGACFGATSAWFQAGLAWLKESLGQVAWAQYMPLAWVLLGVVVLAPIVIYWASQED